LTSVAEVLGCLALYMGGWKSHHGQRLMSGATRGSYDREAPQTVHCPPPHIVVVALKKCLLLQHSCNCLVGWLVRWVLTLWLLLLL
jgi:hypothetical protein